MVKAVVIGATGYAGIELVRLLSRHPAASIVRVSSETYKGQRLADVYPHIGGQGDMVLQEGLGEDLSGADVVFLALPHGLALSLIPRILEMGVAVIDLGADFRLHDPTLYLEWYGEENRDQVISLQEAGIFSQAVYGLPEIHRRAIRGARLVANPGCYPTASILALAPLLRAGLLTDDTVIIDAKSGVSGAGRSPSLKVHFAEVDENLRIYSPAGRHRHTPEIEQELSFLAGRRVTASFNPHLIPMNRGILSTCYAAIPRGVTEADLEALYLDFYSGEPFVRVLTGGRFPETKYATGSNMCFIGVTVDQRAGRAVVVSAIDNLGKGAAGQAVQNMNILFGLDETCGLDIAGIYP